MAGGAVTGSGASPHVDPHKSHYLLRGVGLFAAGEREELRRPPTRSDRGHSAQRRVGGVGREAEVQHAGRVVREVGRERVVGVAERRGGRVALEVAVGGRPTPHEPILVREVEARARPVELELARDLAGLRIARDE